MAPLDPTLRFTIRPLRSLAVIGSLLLCAGLASGCGSSSTAEAPPSDPPAPALTAEQRAQLAAALDAYIDSRSEGNEADPARTQPLIDEIQKLHASFEEIEEILRQGRAAYPSREQLGDIFGKVTKGTVSTFETEYTTEYRLYVPSSYDPELAYSLAFIGHGGNSAMTADRAGSVAADYMKAYQSALGAKGRMILVAPATTVGWGAVGNSLLFSTISKLTRDFHIDPDRIFVMGQSMGGHLAYRTALNFGDRFGAFSPQSGGYDYTSAEQGKPIANLFTTSAYVTYGDDAKGELYGIGALNNTNKAWLEERKYDWVMVQKDGGHEIFADELPKILAFFNEHPRNMYRPRTYYKAGGTMRFDGEDNPAWTEVYKAKPGRVLRWNMRHFLEMRPRPDFKDGPLVMYGEVQPGNVIDVHTQNVEHVRVYLHPKMGIDLLTAVTIRVNGETSFSGKVERSASTLLETVREFDDRGRIFYGAVDLDVASSESVPEPSYQ